MSWSPERRLAMKVEATIERLNKLLLEAKRMSLEIHHQIDTKQVTGVPLFVISLSKKLEFSKPKPRKKRRPIDINGDKSCANGDEPTTLRAVARMANGKGR